jgi:transcriptional regulator with XRE-family HTH domain
MESFAENIKRLRKEKNVTLKDLQGKTGTHKR